MDSNTRIEYTNPFAGLSPLEKYNRKQAMFAAWGRGMKMLHDILSESEMQVKREAIWASCELTESKVEPELPAFHNLSAQED